jgi:predicted ester cyclase
MSTTENKALARRFLEEVFNQRRLEAIEALTVPGYIDHNLPSGVTVAQSISAFLAGFPDVHFTIEDQIEEGELVVTRWTARGTHTGNLFGIPPTGKSMTMPGISIYRIANSKLVEAWVQYDQLGMMQQLGLVPMPS